MKQEHSLALVRTEKHLSQETEEVTEVSDGKLPHTLQTSPSPYGLSPHLPLVCLLSHIIPTRNPDRAELRHTRTLNYDRLNRSHSTNSRQN